MFWGTADNTGSDSREPNNADHCMLKDSQSGLGYLPACCLSPFSPLLEIGSSKERLGGELFPVPLSCCFAFPFGQKGGRNGWCFSFCSLPSYMLGQTSGVSISLTKFFSSPLLFHLACFQANGYGRPLPFFVCLLKQHPCARAFYLLLQTNILRVWKSHYRNKWEERTPCRGIVTHVMLGKAGPWRVFTNWTFPPKPYTGKDIEYHRSLGYRLAPS